MPVGDVLPVTQAYPGTAAHLFAQRLLPDIPVALLYLPDEQP